MERPLPRRCQALLARRFPCRWRFRDAVCGLRRHFERFGRSPRESINFIAAHDGFTLRDLVSYSAKHNLANGEHNRDGNDAEICWNSGAEGETADVAVIERRKADVRALLATLFLSLGTPMLTAGDEFGRTQDGNNNAYAQDNATTWADWAKADDTLAAFVAGLVRLRAQNPALTDNVFLTGRAAGDATCPDVVWLRADATPMRDDDWGRADFIAMTRAGSSGGRLHLAFNCSRADLEMLAPQTSQGMRWVLALDSASAFVGAREIADGRLTVNARSVVAAGRDCPCLYPDSAGALLRCAGAAFPWRRRRLRRRE